MTQHPTSALLPRALGYGGAIPFVAIALMLHLSDNQDFLRHALLAYGACIVSFLGAIHWGERLSTFGTGKALSARLGWSVVPSLAAWAILAIGGRFALAAMAAALACCLLVDLYFARFRALPRWYVNMRIILTVIGCISLLSVTY
jgi:hypothetical protein